jgi:hypothetical protein
MAEQAKFQVRETQEEMKKLDAALKVLGYKDRADWYREIKRKTLELARQREKE